MHIANMLLSAITHGLIYDAICKAERHLGLHGSILAAVIGIATAALVSHFIFRRSRGRAASRHSCR